MPLYKQRPQGLYASGGNWTDPAIWFNEKGHAVSRIPTAADNVYITGNVTGSGVANNITVGTLSEIGGAIVRRGNALGIAEECCCPTCGQCCWKITGSYGCPRPKVTVNHGTPPGVRVDFADSYNCGGPCYDTQGITLTTKYENDNPVTLTVNADGLVETQNAPFDFLRVRVNGTLILELNAYGEGGGCRMKQTSGSGTISLPVGCHTIEINSLTNDALYHVGFYYNVNFSVSGSAGETCTANQLCNGYNCDQTYGCQPVTAGQYAQYETLAACEAACTNPKRYYCNIHQGCRETYNQSAPYATLSDCENSGACVKTYNCHSSSGCLAVINGSGAYATLSACEADCIGKWECNYYTGCIGTFSVGGVSGGPHTSLSACQAACYRTYICQHFGCTQGGYSDDPANNTLAECQAICLPRYSCDVSSGCVYIGHATTGDTLQECQAACTIQSYNCDNSNGCVPLYNDATGTFATLTACQASCLERASCDTYAGCQYAGYDITGNLYSNCATDCTIQSYNCDDSSGCVPLYNDATGTYSTLNACANVCLARYVCTIDSYYYGYYAATCSFSGYATSGNTQNECVSDCEIKSWFCDPYSGCQPLLDTSGAYTTQSTCNIACVYSYSCFASYYYGYYCQGVGYVVNGTDYYACAANCPPPQMQMPPQAMTEAPPDVDELMKLVSAQNAIKEAEQNTPEWQRYFVGVSNPPALPPPVALEDQDPLGPGTFLSKTLEKIGIKSSPTCSCKARARHMNEMGNDWCADNVPMIVSWLREEAEKRRLPFIDMAGTLLVKRAISLSRAAKKKQAKNGSTTPSNSDS